MSALEALIAANRDDLRESLEGLGVVGEEVLVRAERVAIEAANVSVAKLLGQDTTVAERALKASALTLASASTSAVARQTLTWTSNLMSGIVGAAVKAAIAVL